MLLKTEVKVKGFISDPQINFVNPVMGFYDHKVKKILIKSENLKNLTRTDS